MAIDFMKSRTRENLMRAFAGESQARNRYTIAAKTAKEQGMYAVSQIFLFTADQERAHAERYYQLLKKSSGSTIAVDGAYPVDHSDNVTKLLEAAKHNELEEFSDVYPAFGEIAKEEGFLEESTAFYQIAKIEEIHAKRFEKLAELLEKGEYYESAKEQDWMCLNCGHIYRGKMVPDVCPVCRYEKGYFIPAELGDGAFLKMPRPQIKG